MRDLFDPQPCEGLSAALAAVDCADPWAAIWARMSHANCGSHPRELFGWHLSRTGEATTAHAREQKFMSSPNFHCRTAIWGYESAVVVKRTCTLQNHLLTAAAVAASLFLLAVPALADAELEAAMDAEFRAETFNTAIAVKSAEYAGRLVGIQCDYEVATTDSALTTLQGGVDIRDIRSDTLSHGHPPYRIDYLARNERLQEEGPTTSVKLSILSEVDKACRSVTDRIIEKLEAPSS